MEMLGPQTRVPARNLSFIWGLLCKLSLAGSRTHGAEGQARAQQYTDHQDKNQKPGLPVTQAWSWLQSCIQMKRWMKSLREF